MKTQHLSNSSLPIGTTLYRFNGVPIIAQPGFWPIPAIVTIVLAWLAGLRNPGRSWIQCLGIGLLALPVALFADIGHAMAHTISAKMVGAPMDEILLALSMPRTLYQNNEVPPRTHIGRSLGGPIFSLISFLLSYFWRRFSPAGSVRRDLADLSLFGHGFILLSSIIPLPMVDGGVILKWKLVEAGQTPAQAEKMVHRASLGLGAVVLGLGAVLGFIGKRKLVGGLLAAGGAATVAAGFGWLK
jgi:hypothetical protein